MDISEDIEKQYIPSLTTGDASSTFAYWRQQAAETQKRLRHVADIPYGAHPREILDFYPAENARGCVVFIHGGYWQAFSKFETSWVADGFVGQGLSVALINYPLCPELKISGIRASCIKAFVQLYTQVLNAAERNGVVVTGHSAGGYLAAAHVLEDWAAMGLPANPIKGVIPISGVFNVAPLMQTSLNKALVLDVAQAKALNLNSTRPRCTATLALAVGKKETTEFHRQSADLASSWALLNPRVLDVAGVNHFTVLDSLAETSGVLNRLAVEMAGR